MHFYNYHDQLKKIDRAGRGAIISKGIATGAIGFFLLATAFTMDIRLLFGSVLCLSICWMLDAYFKVIEEKYQQLLDISAFKQPHPKDVAKSWAGELFFSLNGLFYFLAILFHGCLFLLLK
ncbi:hypothetical protein [Echinicola vietnamensis]|uniref:Uncharacterized protein n=1 Tax=Echinicola vietnamensis (strain DSM 17526 / LMG 23754 / KMM 6221) TaxID=926556 RepID=L0G3Q8_ECHVK|nr:hypothetical protein [Echinicola vietnamensis]AGA79621.1 hypothetical protein Echvi_3401 [Echinicola vietnamensis DSM 17526]